MDADFCVAALEEVMNRYGVPEIFNTDQGAQFTSQEFTQALKDAGVAISMDGKGRWMDNVFIERLWRSVKWKCLYLRELEAGSQARRALEHWFHFITNGDRIPPLTVSGPWTSTGKERPPRRRHDYQPGFSLETPPNCPT